MHDVLDIIKNVQSLYAVGPTLGILKDFERVIDELDVYVFTNWDEGKGYTLQIGGRKGKKSKVIWEISSEENNTFLSITIYPHFLANAPRFLSFLPYKLLLRPKLTSYLNSVLGGINYYLIEKEPVPKNHFGTHKWFS